MSLKEITIISITKKVSLWYWIWFGFICLIWFFVLFFPLESLASVISMLRLRFFLTTVPSLDCLFLFLPFLQFEQNFLFSVYFSLIVVSLHIFFRFTLRYFGSVYFPFLQVALICVNSFVIGFSACFELFNFVYRRERIYSSWKTCRFLRTSCLSLLVGFVRLQVYLRTFEDLQLWKYSKCLSSLTFGAWGVRSTAEYKQPCFFPICVYLYISTRLEFR